MDNWHGYCDKFGQENVSPDWKGPHWYRVEESIGTQIPEGIIEQGVCNTMAPSWINGTHPESLYETVEREICFNVGGPACYMPKNILIKKCESFFVYHLDETFSGGRYCIQ